jgi:uncharacterized phage protein (TIGR02218 family)
VPLTLPDSWTEHSQQQTHFRAKLYRITRTDNEQFYFTDHDSEIQGHDGNTYEPAGGFETSAVRNETGLQDQQVDARGAITSDRITFDDLRAGRFQEAEVVVFEVDWRAPWGGPLSTRKFFIETTAWNGEDWTAELSGLTAKLRHKVGRIVNRNCDAEELGDSRCQYNLTTNAWDQITSVTVLAGSQDASEPRRIFRAVLADIPSLGPDQDEYKYGKIVWATGSGNVGVVSEVKLYSHTSPDRQITLNLPTPFDIEDNDDFELTTGCSRLFSVCDSKFGNRLNFQGFPHVPSSDEVLQTPNAR